VSDEIPAGADPGSGPPGGSPSGGSPPAPGPVTLPPPSRHLIRPTERALLAGVAVAAIGAVIAAWGFVGSVGAAGAILVTFAGFATAFAALWRRTLECLVHENGIALAAAGRIRGRVFWQDLVNLLEDGRSGRFRLFTQDASLELPVRSFERAEEVRETIRIRWNNLWGYKVATFPEIGFFYSPSAIASARDRVNSATLEIALAAILALYGGVKLLVIAAGHGGLLQATLPLLLLVGGAVLLPMRRRDRRSALAAQAAMDATGGIQIRDTSIQVFSRTGELREIPFADVAEVVAPPEATIELRLRSGEMVAFYPGLAWFEKFRDWLLDSAREQGVKVA